MRISALSFVAWADNSPYLCAIKTEVPKLYESSPSRRACTKRFPEEYNQILTKESYEFSKLSTTISEI